MKQIKPITNPKARIKAQREAVLGCFIAALHMFATDELLALKKGELSLDGKKPRSRKEVIA